MVVIFLEFLSNLVLVNSGNLAICKYDVDVKGRHYFLKSTLRKLGVEACTSIGKFPPVWPVGGYSLAKLFL